MGKLKDELKRQVFSIAGSLVSAGMYAYNSFKPTSVSVVPQSALGESASPIVVSLGALAVFLLIISVVVFFLVRHKHKRKKKRS